MDKTEMLARINTKIDEINARLVELKLPGVNEHTARTQTQVKKTQKNNLLVIKELLETGNIVENIKVFESLTTLTSDRFTTIEVKKGDKLLEIIQKYPEKKYEQIVTAITKAGLEIDFTIAGGILK